MTRIKAARSSFEAARPLPPSLDARLEREADRTAARVTAAPHGAVSAEGLGVDPHMGDGLRTPRARVAKASGGAGLGGGRPLPPGTRRRLTPDPGLDLASVRVHTDERAGARAAALGAAAFTLGSEVVFGPGRYQPGSPTGQALIAHELAHVAQQRDPSVGLAVQRSPLDPTNTAALPYLHKLRAESGPLPEFEQTLAASTGAMVREGEAMTRAGAPRTPEAEARFEASFRTLVRMTALGMLAAHRASVAGRIAEIEASLAPSEPGGPVGDGVKTLREVAGHVAAFREAREGLRASASDLRVLSDTALLGRHASPLDTLGEAFGGPSVFEAGLRALEADLTVHANPQMRALLDPLRRVPTGDEDAGGRVVLHRVARRLATVREAQVAGLNAALAGLYEGFPVFGHLDAGEIAATGAERLPDAALREAVAVASAELSAAIDEAVVQVASEDVHPFALPLAVEEALLELPPALRPRGQALVRRYGTTKTLLEVGEAVGALVLIALATVFLGPAAGALLGVIEGAGAAAYELEGLLDKRALSAASGAEDGALLGVGDGHWLEYVAAGLSVLGALGEVATVAKLGGKGMRAGAAATDLRRLDAAEAGVDAERAVLRSSDEGADGAGRNLLTADALAGAMRGLSIEVDAAFLNLRGFGLMPDAPVGAIGKVPPGREDEAFRLFEAARLRSPDREVAIMYSPATDEFVIVQGSPGSVGLPRRDKLEASFGPHHPILKEKSWKVTHHTHPNAPGRGVAGVHGRVASAGDMMFMARQARREGRPAFSQVAFDTETGRQRFFFGFDPDSGTYTFGGRVPRTEDGVTRWRWEKHDFASLEAYRAWANPTFGAEVGTVGYGAKNAAPGGGPTLRSADDADDAARGLPTADRTDIAVRDQDYTDLTYEEFQELWEDPRGIDTFLQKIRSHPHARKMEVLLHLLRVSDGADGKMAAPGVPGGLMGRSALDAALDEANTHGARLRFAAAREERRLLEERLAAELRSADIDLKSKRTLFALEDEADPNAWLDADWATELQEAEERLRAARRAYERSGPPSPARSVDVDLAAELREAERAVQIQHELLRRLERHGPSMGWLRRYGDDRTASELIAEIMRDLDP